MIKMLAAVVLAAALGAPPAAAQAPDSSRTGHDMSSHGMAGHDMSAMSGHDMAGMEHMHHGMEMSAMYGPYPMTREASGTSWQPDLAMHRGTHAMKGAWMLMLHGMGDLTYDDQGGPRGDEKWFASNMLMGMAQRPVGPGRLGFRTMLSLEPATIGKKGYPLLLQTGETADGVHHLIDRQHPHDLFMELAASYSISSGTRSFFVYGGPVGEPALGPPAFMHRFSAMEFPQAPITHHWLDSSHITFGVLTGGVVLGDVKFEASSFRGREPDMDRWNIEEPKLDSHSFRFSVNPSPAWALQVSRGRLHSPEELEPDVDVDRTTASVVYASQSDRAHREVTFAWGRNKARPGRTLDAFAAEAAIQYDQRHTIFARAERVEKDELFLEGDPLEGKTFKVSQLDLGYRYDLFQVSRFVVGLGAVGTVSIVPDEIRGVYGDTPTSGFVFLHSEIR